MQNKYRQERNYRPRKKNVNLATKSEKQKLPQRREGYVSRIVPKSISRTRMDISNWQGALRAADNVDTPRRARLINLYNDILLDAHTTSQLELRFQHSLPIPFVLKRDGKEDEENTDKLKRSLFKPTIDRAILETVSHGHSLPEFTTTPEGNLIATILPRQNVVPEQGLLLLKEDDTTGIAYRNIREYGTWVLEFGEKHEYGLLNKAVPHVLMKRFAQSCWSELCEIYGIPPRFMKTDTSDPSMLDRAEEMMRDMGAAAYFIIDTAEEFQFAKGADTNGDVYNNLISLCKNELSTLLNGVIVGQDTAHGNRSKEETSIKLQDKLIQSDKRLLETSWNNTVLPALVRIGFLPEGLTYELQQEEDIEKLWSMTKEAMPYMDVDTAWVSEKFGIKVTGKREMPEAGQLRINTDHFFD